MTDERIKNTIGACVIGLTRHVMNCDGVTHDVAYCRVMGSELMKLLSDPDTRLYLEPNAELVKLYDIEADQGIEALYAAISEL